MYCRASDHDTEECPTLLVKIQEKRNQNNQNVQWISAEARDDGRNINIVTRGGTKIGNDAVRQEPTQNQWIKKNTDPKKQFDVHLKKRRLLGKPDKNFRRRTQRRLQLRNQSRKSQNMRCHHHWIIPTECNPRDK
jgi:hypothetical protein